MRYTPAQHIVRGSAMLSPVIARPASRPGVRASSDRSLACRAAALLALLAVPFSSAQYDIDTRLPSCQTLQWSEAVHRAYPDVEQICEGIYQRDGRFYARASIEVVRSSGNRMTIRTLHTDGSVGHQRSMRVPPDWRATIGGREYRAAELLPGQKLSVFIPQERFELMLEADQESAPLEEDGSPATVAE